MTDHFDVSTLNWVKGEIDDTLKEARIVLEKYADDPEDEAQIHFCAVHLHQVAGTLEMVELRGAAQFAAEMEKLADALPHISPREPAFEVLMRTLLLLPDYLEVLQSGQPDSPIILLPLLNELRRARGERELTAAGVFLPKLDVAAPGAASQSGDLRVLSRRLRPHYQAALLNVLKGSDVAASLRRIGEALDKLAGTATNAGFRRWVWVGGALVEALLDGGIALEAAIKLLLSKYEQVIKQLTISGEEGLNSAAIDSLLRATLFEIAKATGAGPRLTEIRHAFRIDALLPPPEMLEKIRSGLGGFNSELKKAVSRDVIEELSRIKDVLDLFGRTQGRPGGELRSIADALTHIADVLGLLRENALGDRLRRQVEEIHRAVRSDATVEGSLLMDVAESVLSVESALSDWGAVAPMEAADDASGQVAIGDAAPEAEAEHRRVVRQVMKEAKDDLVKAREAINAYVQNPEDKAPLAEAPRLLHQIAGSLLMLSYRRVAQVIKACQRFVETDLAAAPALPPIESLDALADAMMSVEYYLEAFVESRVHPSSVLDVAERAAATIGYPVDLFDDDASPVAAAVPRETVNREVAESAEITASAPVQLAPALPPSPVAGSDLDEEIIAIFIEEAQEEFRKIGEMLPRWAADADDDDALRELRRSFHTLKGSGRLVGAMVLGEFAWVFENLLNRVIDHSVTACTPLFDLIEKARQALPSLLSHFRGGPAPSDEVVRLQETAVAIAKGEVPAMAAAPTSADTRPGLDISIKDPILRDIYTREAEAHLAQLESFVAICRGTRSRVTDGLVRSLHTLCGSSRTAGVPSVALLAATLEKYAKMRQGSGEPVETEAVDVLGQAAGFVAGVIAYLRDEQTSPPVLGELPRRAEALLSGSAPPSGTPCAEGGAMATTGEATIGLPEESIDYRALASELEAQSDFHEEARPDLPAFHFELDLEEEATPLPAAEKATGEDEVAPASSQLGQCEGESLLAADVPLTLPAPIEHEPAAGGFEAHDEAGSDGAVNIAPIVLESLATDSPTDEGLIALRAFENELTAVPVALEEEALAAPAHAENDLLESLLCEVEEVSTEAEKADRSSARETPELLDVFANEASDLLSASDELLQEWIDRPHDRRSVEALQRLLHTLKGSARWAGVVPIADLGHALESTFAAVVEGRLPASEEVQLLARRTQDRLEALLAEVRGGGDADGVQELIDKLKALVAGASPMATAGRPPRVRDYDPDLLAIFLEEGHELLNASDEALHSWTTAPEDKQLVETLQRLLHTLKGGARMAGVAEIGDLGHALESMLAGVTDGLVGVSPRMFALLQRAHDRLAVMLEQLRHHDPVPAGDDIIADIDALIDGEEPAMPAVEAAAEKAEPPEQPANSSLAPSGGTEQDHLRESDLRDRDHRDRRTGSRPQYELVRVRSDLLDSMVNVAGEASIFRSRVEQQIGGFRFNLDELNQVIERLRERLRMFDIETEAQIQSRFEEAAQQGYEEFDPLELDRFTHMQQLSRSMVESLGDLSSIGGALHNITRETETLLVQQARVNTELQEGLMHTRMVPLVQNAPRLRRIVRQTCGELGKEAELRFKGAEVEMDRSVVERILAPLEHLLRNAVAHGIESPGEREAQGKPHAGSIVVDQVREGTEVVVRVSDDGRGINVGAVRERAIARGLMSPEAQLSEQEITLFILEPGFTTAESVTQIAGRGVGMDVVNSEVKNLNGSFAIDSEFGKGTTFTIRLPMTLTVSRALLVYAGEDMYAVPLLSIEGIVRASDADVAQLLAQEQPTYRWLGHDYDVLHLATTLGLAGAAHDAAEGGRRSLLLAHSGEHRVALVVDCLLGSREIVVKPIGRQLGSLRALSGATILGDGRVALILELPALIRMGLASRGEKVAKAETVDGGGAVKPTVMVVDDSITVRKVTSRLLERNDMNAISAKDGVEAVTLLQENVPDVMLLDIEMPRMDGYELATHVRNEPRLRHVPIIMITSRSGEKHRQRAIQIGVNIYMTKPFQENELLANIRSLLPACDPVAAQTAGGV